MSVLRIKATSWDKARSVFQRLAEFGWVFRGHSDVDWTIQTAFERNADQFTLGWFAGKRVSGAHLIVERTMLRQFVRRAHHFVNTPPGNSEKLEWLALAQHHGGATRLLDFTRSFYVAAFFALETAWKDAAVICVNRTALLDKIRSKKNLPNGSSEVVNKALRNLVTPYIATNQKDRLVIPVEPERLNERISIQQGLFLFPCDREISFEQNLSETFGLSGLGFVNHGLTKDFDPKTTLLIKLVIPRKSHRRALDDLWDMNVSAKTLFPGLDGFARSLNYQFRLNDKDGDRKGMRPHPIRT